METDKEKEAEEVTLADEARKSYDIGGVTYRLEAQSWKQCKWLGDAIFKGRDVRSIDYGVIHDCGRELGPLFMAIALLPANQSRMEKSRMAWSEIEALAQEFEAWLTSWEVARFCTHFFYYCRPEQMVMLIPGKVMQEEFQKIALSLSPSENGPSAQLSPLPMATLPSETLSPTDTGRKKAKDTSSVALSGKP